MVIILSWTRRYSKLFYQEGFKLGCKGASWTKLHLETNNSIKNPKIGFNLDKLTKLENSWRSKTTRASICQYSALCKPLCSNQIRPGCGHGILQLISNIKQKVTHKLNKNQIFKTNFIFEKLKALVPGNKIGDEVSETLVISKSIPDRIDIGIDQNIGLDSALPPRNQLHFALHLPLSSSSFLPRLFRVSGFLVNCAAAIPGAAVRELVVLIPSGSVC